MPESRTSSAVVSGSPARNGRAAGRAEGLAEGRPRAAPAYRDLALRVREAAVNAGLQNTLAAAALTEVAWALVLGDGRFDGVGPRKA